jgi:hypothetical protein
MRYPASAKHESIRIVEQSHLPVRRSLHHRLEAVTTINAEDVTDTLQLALTALG